MSYNCKTCTKTFSRKFNLERHSETCKKVIKEPKEEAEAELEIGECANCGKILSNKFNLDRHMKICKKVIVKKEIIKTVPFEDTEKDYITDDDYKKIFVKGFKCVDEYIRMVHFNELHPENHNIYLGNMQKKTPYIFDKRDGWILTNDKDIIDDLFKNSCEELIEKYDEMKNKLSEKLKEKFDKFINDFKCDNLKIQKDEFRLLFYNKKKFIKDSIIKNT